MTKKTLISFILLGLGSTSFAHDQFFITTPFESLSTKPATLELRLSASSFVFPVGQQYESSSLTHLLKSYGQRIDPYSVVFSSPNLPSGLAINNQKITGQAVSSGNHSFTLTAETRGTSVSRTYTAKSIATIQAINGVRSWSDGSIARSCEDYIVGSEFHEYSGSIGDGIYKIEPTPGRVIDVYCDMTRDGGGWMLLMKQAKDDGTTLQGSSTYWTTGTPLNDTPAHQSKADGNFVSTAFGSAAVRQLRLEAANEETMKYHTASASSALDLFKQPITVYQDKTAGTPGTQKYPDWYIHNTHYLTGLEIGISRFDFNFGIHHPQTGTIRCGARWGWAIEDLNSMNLNIAPSHDMCSGLGGLGDAYGTTWMLNSKNSLQPATLYLWGK